MRIEPPVAGNGTLKNFALYLFCGLVIWNFFNGVVNGSMGALVGAGPLLRKVYFPPECPAIANGLTVLIQTGIEVGILVAGHDHRRERVLDVPPVPYLLLLLAMFSLGIGLVLSLFNVYFRDIKYLVGIGMNLLFYGTPIVYPYTLVEENAPRWVELLVTLNPLTQFVGASRDIFYLLQVPSPARMIGLTVVSIVTFAGGWTILPPSPRT